MRMMKIFCILLFLLLQPVMAFDYWEDLTKRYEKKDQKRWTVSDWLSQKTKFSLMDSWLAANRSTNFFEMFLAGSKFLYDVKADGTTTADKTIHRYASAFYLSLFGLGLEQDSSDQNFSVINYLVYLRLLGTEVQGTNFTVYYGQRTYKEDSGNYSQENPFYGGLLSLYLFPVFGIEGDYRLIMNAKDSNSVNVSGYRSTYGAFFEFSFLRVYGHAISETIVRDSGTPLREERAGTEVGVKLFF